MSPLELVDDRFGELARKLRAARPVASEGLRERVRALAPSPTRRFELNFRMLVPRGRACRACRDPRSCRGAGCAPRLDLTTAGCREPRRRAAQSRDPAAPRLLPTPMHSGQRPREHSGSRPSPAGSSSTTQISPCASTTRDDLSKRTQDALRFTRRLGGYVVWARYAAPGDRGDSELALRVPVEHVQAAIAHFSGYGSLVRQQIVLKDLQQRVDDLTARIGRLRAEIAAIKQQLAGVLTPERRAALEQRLRRDQARVALLTRLEGCKRPSRRARPHRADDRRPPEGRRSPRPPPADGRRGRLGAGPRARGSALRPGRRRSATRSASPPSSRDG